MVRKCKPGRCSSAMVMMITAQSNRQFRDRLDNIRDISQDFPVKPGRNSTPEEKERMRRSVEISRANRAIVLQGS